MKFRIIRINIIIYMAHTKISIMLIYIPENFPKLKFSSNL